jgi:hypothetical protein
MSWIGDNSAAISALGSIVMNISTIAIIFFNIHQFKLSRSSLNIEINFRLFEQRKKLYSDLSTLLGLLDSNGNFAAFTEEKEGVLVTNEHFATIKAMIDDSEYLYSDYVYSHLRNLLHVFTQGIYIETQMHDIKQQDVENWTDKTTETLKELSEERKKLLNYLRQFDANMLTEYLNISRFNRDFIGERRNFSANKFSHIMLAVKNHTTEFLNQNKDRIDSISKF